LRAIVGHGGDWNLVESLLRRIRAYSPKAELTTVIVVAFGYFSLGSVLSVLFPVATPPITQRHLIFLLIYESSTLFALGSILYARGWNTKRIGLKITARDTLIGVGLALVTYAAYVVVWWIAVASGIHPSFPGSYRELASHGLTLPAVAAVSILNPIYEETFLCGYIVTAAKENHRISAGINLSVAIRLVYHLYQGSVGVLGVIPLGLLFALWYARTGRLWPLFVAHALFDATGLLQFVGQD